jgi:hypothetical protein
MNSDKIEPETVIHEQVTAVRGRARSAPRVSAAAPCIERPYASNSTLQKLGSSSTSRAIAVRPVRVGFENPYLNARLSHVKRRLSAFTP